MTTNRETPADSLSSEQPDETQSPLKNWMDLNQQPETAPTDNFGVTLPSSVQRILFIPLRSIFSFMRSHTRTIKAGVVVVVAVTLFFIFRPDGAADMHRDNSKIQFDDVTIHPLNSHNAVTTGWATQDENSASPPFGLQTSVSVGKSHTNISPVQSDASTTQNTSDEKQGAWLTGKIEFDETFQSRSPQSQSRVGQRFEYFSQKRD